MLKHYVEFVYPGIIVSETSTKQIPERIATFDIPKTSFGYRLFDREEIILHKETLTGKPKNYSDWVYIGKALTLSEVKLNYPKDIVLISNMRNNNIKRVCHTRFGQFIPMNNPDKVLTI